MKIETSLKNKKRNESIWHNFMSHENGLKKYLSKFFLSSHEIDDICQEAFLRSFESNMKNEIKQPKSFIYRVATNLLMSQYRRSSYKLTDYIDDVGEELMPVDASNIENDINAQRQLGVFCESIATLPEQCRKVLVMRKVYGFSIKEISKQLNMPTSTINYNIAKGMVCCDDAMEKYESEILTNRDGKKSDKLSPHRKSNGGTKS